MDKLKLAHDYALKQMESLSENSTMQSLVSVAWQYADAMQAEADKRNKAEEAEKRKEVREILKDANTFIKREGQNFNDIEEAKREGEYFFKLFCRQNGIDDMEEWQPDWSQAPEWAVAWTMDSGETLWWSYKPELNNGYWFVEDSVVWQCAEAPSFGLTGSHIVERPDVF